MTWDDLYDMAFRELGLTETDFFCLPPFRTYFMQMHSVRQRERQWEQSRFIAAMVHNTTPGVKRAIKETQLIQLSFDRKKKYPEWTQEEAQELIDLWPDINN